MKDTDLLQLAMEAKRNAYSPYSGFRVGAAVLTDTGAAYSGANIENASFGATCCAERTAVFKAISAGETKILAIAICSDSKDPIYPCGICRQVLAEFGDDAMRLLCADGNGVMEEYTLGELLPKAFRQFKGTNRGQS